MKRFFSGALAALFSCMVALGVQAQDSPKREFRGAWLHIVGNQSIKKMSTDQVKAWITGTLDSLQIAGCNAIIYQVRPQADAFYQSDYEPWTRFLTGVQGQAPAPYWDPLQFAIEESHKRGMELHAWLNPYRVTSNDQEVLCKEHLYFKKPELFLKYGKQLYLDPGEPEAVEHSVKVIKDIVERYDVDAVHFDDYFYPYPIANQDFPDTASFRKYAAAQGFGPDRLSDWRRNNVTTLIKKCNEAIKGTKPWVRFGISPFGIHRNLKQDPAGSKTNGLSTYDDLYADIPLWCKLGYIDYNVPQLYWRIGLEVADYDVLIHWWNDGNFGGHLYIGQSISSLTYPDLKDSTKIQLEEKMRLVRELPNVHGNVWWPGWSIPQSARPVKPRPQNAPAARPRPMRPRLNLMDSLATRYQKYPALIPVYSHLDTTAPEAVAFAKVANGYLFWGTVPTDDPMQEPGFYVVYKFPKGAKVDISDSKYIVAITKDNKYPVKAADKSKYVVTVTDHCWNESAPSKPVTY